ncbi:Tyrosine kinase [Handroanthus impetiginosus]|uniref:Tyrosine kinase n=1 Tax=Handroanthus impetiginosus TaxID=429701 RepID=A0A2G9HGY3_9LAMI|nr:Tyrosine kinase [Handroanthus impetiginosus]
MDQFRQIGEVLGSLKALMVLKHEISINQRQCCLLYDILELAFETISEEIRQNLRLEERNTKWKALELPMKELHKVFKEAELYIRHCMDVKDWWGRAISLHMNRDCVELHVHNLLCCFPVVIEAIETAAEISGVDQEDMHKRRMALMQKYEQECDDPKLFLWKFGKQYLVPREICSRLETAWREDRWLLIEKITEKKVNLGKHEHKLAELLLRKLNDFETSKEKLLQSSILVGAPDYHVKRRLGPGYPSGGGHLKEIHWLGENFALRTFYGDIGPLQADISTMLSLPHPNILQYLCAFHDEDRKEGFLVMELMNKDLGSYIKEHSGQRNKILFSTPVAVDVMLQIARGMEYLHSKKIYHGDLNPSNILLKVRNASIGGFHAKVMGFGMNSIKSCVSKSPKPTGLDPDIWLAPEVLAELEQPGGKCTTKYTEKADVYSFGMLCFELLTGKVPFEDGHLQGEKMVRNIRAGERPLFSYPSPKYLANLTKRCWQTNPNLRPSFSSICRILRYIKKNLVINPDHGHPDSAPPLVDYCDMEAGFLKKFSTEGNLRPVSEIPFQMFQYKIIEKDKISGKKWDLATDGLVHRPGSMFDDEHLAAMDDLFLAPSDRRSVCSEIIDSKNSAIAVDLRSVISEIPHRKLFALDQRSFGSESPRKRLSTAGAETPERKTALVMDQRSPNIQACENKTDQKLATQKLKAEVSDKGIVASKVAECQLASPRIQENSKTAVTKVIEQKLESTEIMEKKQSLKPIMDHKPASAESAEGKVSSRAIGHQNLADIPEKKVLKNTESIHKTLSASSLSSETKTESTAKTIHKEGGSESSEKKPMPIKKLKDPKTKMSPEKPVNDTTKSSSRIKNTKPGHSPASSPARAFKKGAYSDTPKTDSPKTSSARIKKMIPSFSPASSPSRAFKKCDHSEAPKNDTARASPARIKKTVPSFSPAASPSRDFKTCASPKHSSAYHSKEYLSPVSSPLHPCPRCSRLGRQSSMPVNTSPQRPKIDHVSTQVV